MTGTKSQLPTQSHYPDTELSYVCLGFYAKATSTITELSYAKSEGTVSEILTPGSPPPLPPFHIPIVSKQAYSITHVYL